MSLEVPTRILGLLSNHNVSIAGTQELLNFSPKAIRGIGQVYETRLKNRGIKTIRDLSLLETLELSKIPPKLLEKWILAARIILRYTETGKESAVPTKKLLVAGVDQAGKTSVLESLKAMKSVAAQKATIGASATTVLFAGFNIISFDLGGQATFRQAYLSQAEAYFSGVGSLIFVIDIQALVREDEVFDYFQRILRIFDFLKEYVPVTILFHKYDPTGLDKKSIDPACNELEYKYQEFSYSIGYGKLSFHKTSIYDIPGLTNVFSGVFSKISPVSNILNDTLGWFCEEKGFNGAYLFSENLFVIAQSLKNIPKSEQEDIFLRSLQAVRFAAQKGVPDDGTLIELSPFHFYTREIPLGENKVILSLFDVRPGKIDQVELQELDETLTPWIQNFFALM